MRVRRSQKVAWRRLGDEMIVVNLARSEVVALNDSGGLVWESLCDSPGTDSHAASDLSDTPSEGCGNPVASFVEELIHLGLVETCDAEGGMMVASRLERMAGDQPRVLWKEPMQSVVQQVASPPLKLGSGSCGF